MIPCFLPFVRYSFVVMQIVGGKIIASVSVNYTLVGTFASFVTYQDHAVSHNVVTVRILVIKHTLWLEDGE